MPSPGRPAPDPADTPPEQDTATPARPDLLAGERLPPAPRQERSRRKRDALLQSALVLFGERGYEEASIEEIARRAGVAVGSFYQHFASKRQVLLVLMDRLLTEAAALLEAPGSPDANPAPAQGGIRGGIRVGIAGLVRAGLQVDWAYAGAYHAWREAAAVDRGLRELHAQVELWTAARLEVLVRVLLQAPGARTDVDATTLAHVLSLLFWRLIEEPQEQQEAVIASVSDLIYHALISDEQPGGEQTR